MGVIDTVYHKLQINYFNVAFYETKYNHCLSKYITLKTCAISIIHTLDYINVWSIFYKLSMIKYNVVDIYVCV